jgi:hypothetical protein
MLASARRCRAIARYARAMLLLNVAGLPSDGVSSIENLSLHISTATLQVDWLDAYHHRGAPC